MFGFSKEEHALLRRLNTPVKIQDYLDVAPFNFEKNGQTCKSPRRSIREGKMHCIEGAFLACSALMLQGRPPLVLNLKVDRKKDDDHIIVLFKENGYWGAISKTNHAVLRWRDPVYKTTRELAMSYFHEYFLTVDGSKTMQGYSKPINLKRFGTSWLTEEADLWNIAEHIYDSPHTDAVPVGNKKYIKPATDIERRAASIKVS